MHGIMLFVHGVLMAGTLVIAGDYYGEFQEYANQGWYNWFKYFVYAGVFGVSVLWAFGHAVGGCIMGMAAGGIWEGLKMGLILGGGLSIGRLWPYMLTLGVGSFLFYNNWLHTIVLVVVGVACLGVNLSIKFIWSHTSV